MVTTELVSFIQKFYRLWSDGHTAHLDLDTCAGKAWVGLRVQLGHAPGPLHQQQFHFRKKSFGPSRQRQRKRRAAARLNIEHPEEACDPTVVVEETTETDNAQSQNTVEKDRSSIDMNTNIEVEAVEALTENKEVLDSSNIAEEVIEKSNVNEVIKKSTVNEVIEKSNVNKVIQVMGAENTSTAPSVAVCPLPEMIKVYCTATLENCPDSVLSQEYGDSIRRFLGSEPHLQQNIASADMQILSSRSFRNNKYTHTVSMILMVRTARLWENPASYIRKHLGLTNSWSRSNGTVVKLSRIHQK